MGCGKKLTGKGIVKFDIRGSGESLKSGGVGESLKNY